ncbi:MAG: hypothetical protein JO057_17415 [Chloroflexi bacterium]|nr:hypothetical protein [Chloroflexota bacterium]
MRTGQRAVVLGASVAGSLAARVLCDSFEEVVIVERDRLPENAEFRKGVPQSRHIHVLLVRGAQILERLFPGITTALASEGAQLLDWSRDILYLGAAGWGSRFPRSLTLILVHREVLEWSIRQRVLSSPRVRSLQEHDATGLVVRNDTVTGVQLRARPAGELYELAADLVVDASGRGSKSVDWLDALGYPRPRETVINSFVGYASRRYVRRTDLNVDWKALFLLAKAPTLTRSGGLFPINEREWMVTLAGIGRD